MESKTKEKNKSKITRVSEEEKKDEASEKQNQNK